MGKINTRDRRGHFSFGSLGWFPSCFANPRPLPGHDGISPSLSYAVHTGGCQGRFDSPFVRPTFWRSSSPCLHSQRLPGIPQEIARSPSTSFSLCRILIPSVRHIEKRQAQVQFALPCSTEKDSRLLHESSTGCGLSHLFAVIVLPPSHGLPRWQRAGRSVPRLGSPPTWRLPLR